MLFSLSSRAKFRLSGPDRVRFLNGQITQDVGKVSSDTSLPSCICDRKGKIEGIIQVAQAQDGDLRLDAPAELRDVVFQKIDRYLIADDCQLDDITEEWNLWHFVGESAPEIDGSWARSNRLGRPGWDLWDQEQREDHDLAADEEWDRLRIESMVPAWGREATSERFPAELGLEHSMVDFAKGCYLGQEVISRMKMSGKRNYSLVRLEILAGQVVGLPSILTDGEKEVGQMTSLCGTDALAVVKTPSAKVGNHLFGHGLKKEHCFDAKVRNTTA